MSTLARYQLASLDPSSRSFETDLDKKIRAFGKQKLNEKWVNLAFDEEYKNVFGEKLHKLVMLYLHLYINNTNPPTNVPIGVRIQFKEKILEDLQNQIDSGSDDDGDVVAKPSLTTDEDDEEDYAPENIVSSTLSLYHSDTIENPSPTSPDDDSEGDAAEEEPPPSTGDDEPLSRLCQEILALYSSIADELPRNDWGFDMEVDSGEDFVSSTREPTPLEIVNYKKDLVYHLCNQRVVFEETIAELSVRRDIILEQMFDDLQATVVEFDGVWNPTIEERQGFVLLFVIRKAYDFQYSVFQRLTEQVMTVVDAHPRLEPVFLFVDCDFSYERVMRDFTWSYSLRDLLCVAHLVYNACILRERVYMRPVRADSDSSSNDSVEEDFRQTYIQKTLALEYIHENFELRHLHWAPEKLHFKETDDEKLLRIVKKQKIMSNTLDEELLMHDLCIQYKDREQHVFLYNHIRQAKIAMFQNIDKKSYVEEVFSWRTKMWNCLYFLKNVVLEARVTLHSVRPVDEGRSIVLAEDQYAHYLRLRDRLDEYHIAVDTSGTGCGKTYVSSYIGYTYDAVFVACPLIVVSKWFSMRQKGVEIEHVFSFSHFAHLGGKLQPSRMYGPNASKVYLTSKKEVVKVERIQYVEYLNGQQKVVKKPTNRSEEISILEDKEITVFYPTDEMKKCLEKGRVLLIVDEWQNTKNDSQKLMGTAALARLVRNQGGDILCLSATPSDKPDNTANLIDSGQVFLGSHAKKKLTAGEKEQLMKTFIIDKLEEHIANIGINALTTLDNQNLRNLLLDLYNMREFSSRQRLNSVYFSIVIPRIYSHMNALPRKFPDIVFKHMIRPESSPEISTIMDSKRVELTKQIKGLYLTKAYNAATDADKKRDLANELRTLGVFNVALDDNDKEILGVEGDVIELDKRASSKDKEEQKRISNMLLFLQGIVYKTLEEIKIHEAVNIINERKDRNPNEKYIIALNFIKNIYFAHDKLTESLGPDAVFMVYGKTSPMYKDDIINRFQNDPECRVLIIQMEVGNAGIDLDDKIGNSPRMMFISMRFNLISAIQMCGRVNRKDTKSDPSVFFLFIKDDALDKVYNEMKAKYHPSRDRSRYEDAPDMNFEQKLLELSKTKTETLLEHDISSAQRGHRKTATLYDRAQKLLFGNEGEDNTELVEGMLNIDEDAGENSADQAKILYVLKTKNPYYRSEFYLRKDCRLVVTEDSVHWFCASQTYDLSPDLSSDSEILPAIVPMSVMVQLENTTVIEKVGRNQNIVTASFFWNRYFISLDARFREYLCVEYGNDRLKLHSVDFDSKEQHDAFLFESGRILYRDQQQQKIATFMAEFIPTAMQLKGSHLYMYGSEMVDRLLVTRAGFYQFAETLTLRKRLDGNLIGGLYGFPDIYSICDGHQGIRFYGVSDDTLYEVKFLGDEKILYYGMKYSDYVFITDGEIVTVDLSAGRAREKSRIPFILNPMEKMVEKMKITKTYINSNDSSTACLFFHLIIQTALYIQSSRQERVQFNSVDDLRLTGITQPFQLDHEKMEALYGPPKTDNYNNQMWYLVSTNGARRQVIVKKTPGHDRNCRVTSDSDETLALLFLDVYNGLMPSFSDTDNTPVINFVNFKPAAPRPEQVEIVEDVAVGSSFFNISDDDELIE